jgi:hypothetical protein
MGEQRQRLVSGEAKMDNVVFWGSDEAVMMFVGWPVSETQS